MAGLRVNAGRAVPMVPMMQPSDPGWSGAVMAAARAAAANESAARDVPITDAQLE